ncbi:hypothetical protein DL767_004077 [Monosporascus sp. MG133]|nr:hypothetical protein DL767_004077 [Monosporascus sp. MG133]
MYLLTGSPSSGKSNAFSAALARDKSTFAICVQMRERTARSSAAYALSTVVAGGGPSIACLGPRQSRSHSRHQARPRADYVSYKWLERMGINFPALAALRTPITLPTDHPRDYSVPRDGWLLFFVLHDVHLQTMGQELGYLTLYRVRRATEDKRYKRLSLRVVVATSYPHPDTLCGHFGMKDPAWAAEATVSLLRLHPAIQRIEWAPIRLRVLGPDKVGRRGPTRMEALLTNNGAAALEAADNFGLDIRVAAFLEEAALDAADVSAEDAEGASEAESSDVLLLAIAMAAAAPGLVHRAASRGPGFDHGVLAELGIRGLTGIGEGRWYGGDHWVDAALLALRDPEGRRRATCGVSEARHFLRLGAGRPRRRHSPLRCPREVIGAVGTVFYRWMEAFRHGLIYVAADDVFAGRREGILISTGRQVGIHPAWLLRLDRLAESADERGFYLVHSGLERSPDSPGRIDAKGIMSLPTKHVAELENAKPESTLRERVAYNSRPSAEVAMPVAADMGDPGARKAGDPEARETGDPGPHEREGHYSRECVGPVVPMGYLSGTCVECEETGHVYGPRCPKWEETKDTAAMKLIWFRQNKPEAQSDTNLADLLEERLDARDEHWLGARNFYLPWTGLFAWNYQREQEEVQGPGLWTEYKYSFVGRPDLEAPRRPSDPRRGLCADAREAIQKLRNTGYPADSAAPNVDIPRTSSRRAASSVAGSRLKSRSVRSGRDAEPEGCTNCDQPGHNSSLCPSACRACGSSEHKYASCPVWLDACICRPYPRHLLEHCQVGCHLYGDDVPPHRAVECAVRCQFCGEKGHSALEQCQIAVRMFSGVCRVCKAGRHLLQHCNHAWRPDAGCGQRVCCENHCKICGYDEELDVQREEQGGVPHTCQWYKGTDPMRPGSGAHIRCRACGHRMASSGELVDVRLSAVARYTSNARDWEAAKARGQEVGENPWYDELPECPECFKAKYPEGDYKNQSKDLNEMPIDYE